MSHGVTIEMNGIREEAHLLEALRRMGEQPEVGDALIVRADDGDRAVRIRCPREGDYDIGFHRSGGRWHAFADWFWVGEDQAEFLRRFNQEYQAVVVRSELAAEGLVRVVSETRDADTGQILIELEEGDVEHAVRVAAGEEGPKRGAVAHVAGDGTLKLDMVGYRGDTCEQASRGVERSLGPVAERTWHPERWEEAEEADIRVEER